MKPWADPASSNSSATTTFIVYSHNERSSSCQICRKPTNVCDSNCRAPKQIGSGDVMASQEFVPLRKKQKRASTGAEDNFVPSYMPNPAINSSQDLLEKVISL